MTTWAAILAGCYRDWPYRAAYPLVYLRLQGLTVTAAPNGGLSLKPAGLAGPEVLAVARAHKAAILATIEAEGSPSFCPTCHRWRCQCAGATS